MKPVLFSGLILFFVRFSAVAQINDRHHQLAAEMYELDPDVRSMTEEVLRKRNTYYEGDALKNQTKAGEVFTYARVEATGFNSSDDTRAYDYRSADKAFIHGDRKK